VIQQIAVEHRRRYGYRRISAELRRRGMLVQYKRVLRIIRRITCWPCSRGRSVVTGFRSRIPGHAWSRGLAELGSQELTGMNQLWVSGYHRYIRLRR